MSLFIFNFRKEAKVLLLVLALAAAAELAVRSFRARLSFDIVHLKQIPSIAAELSEAKGLKVLFLGNSLTRRGVLLNVIESDLGAHPGTISFARVYPDDTAMFDWYYLFRNYFAGPRAPDYVILGWTETQLSDATPVRPERAASYYGGWNNTHELFTTDLVTFDGRADFVLSNLLASYSEKERIRNRLLTLALPDYRDTAQRFNAAVVHNNRAHSHILSYTRFERFLVLCQQRHVHAIAVAMPLPYVYDIDPEIIRVIHQYGAVLLDLRQVEGISPLEFADGYHLNPRGAEIYSHALAVHLSSVLPVNGEKPPVLAVIKSVRTHLN